MVVIQRNDDPNTAPIEFETEMLQLDLVSPDLIRIRESPTLPSRGRTSIEQVSPGLYHIDSVFDVFVELSLDGGQNFIPGLALGAVPTDPPQPIRVVLVPAPGVLALLGLGLGLIGFRQRIIYRR
jgi:hypothetical protein